MSEVKRYTAWAAEVALPRGTMVVLAADYDTETQALRYALEQWQRNSRKNKLTAEENRARADVLAAELATERLRADAAVGDANAAEQRVAELESLARIFQTWLGASRSQCDESGQRLWDRIENSLAGQQKEPDDE